MQTSTISPPPGQRCRQLQSLPHRCRDTDNHNLSPAGGEIQRGGSRSHLKAAPHPAPRARAVSNCRATTRNHVRPEPVEGSLTPLSRSRERVGVRVKGSLLQGASLPAFAGKHGCAKAPESANPFPPFSPLCALRDLCGESPSSWAEQRPALVPVQGPCNHKETRSA